MSEKARRKTSKAEYFTMRLNPETNPRDADTLRIIRELEAQGFTFKAIAQDAILHAEGRTPEMFSEPNAMTGVIIERMEDTLAQFADHIIKEIDRRGVGTGQSVGSREEERGEDEPSEEAMNFARSFARRQKNGGNK